MTLKDRWRARAASAFLVGPLVAGLLSVASPAQAQFVAPQGTTIDTQLFQPAIGPRNFLTVDNTAVPEHKMFSLGLSLNYQRHPYILYTQGYTMGQSNLVDSQWTTDLSAAIGMVQAQRDYGALKDQSGLDECLRANHIDPARAQTLGVRPIELDGKPGIFALLSTGELGRFRVVVVEPTCAADNPGLMVDTVLGAR